MSTIAADYECDGWVLEENHAPMMEKTFYNCTDDELGANNYWYEEDMASYQEFLCQWGTDSGNCTNPVFAGICSHSCTQLQAETIVDETYHYQTLDPATSVCHQDNDD